MNQIEILQNQKIKLDNELDPREQALGEILHNNGKCQVLSQSPSLIELIIDDESRDTIYECSLEFDSSGNITPILDGERPGWDRKSFACLLQVMDEINLTDHKQTSEHKKYTRKGMINRVLKERRLKADKADYRIEWSDNIYGDHILINEKGIRYKIFLRDFEKETGYSDSMDSKLNKLGTSKHIMFAFAFLKNNKNLYEKLDKQYPFIEIFLDPLNENKISWNYPHELSVDENLLISRYFRNSSFIENDRLTGMLRFVKEAARLPRICIRPEVIEKIEAAWEFKLMDDLQTNYSPDFSKIKAGLYPYQKEGICFTLFKKASIIADEMGLGKTLQAIGSAIMKKDIFSFKKTLVVCPASLKEQWQREIEKFTEEKAIVVAGAPPERAKQYRDPNYYFYIVNYETVLRDHLEINKSGMDFLILDEAQRAKNYETLTSSSLKRINAVHKLVITGTPIENRLIDIYSIMSILDPGFFGPLWEFSYQHCLFDPEKPNKINGYYNLHKLNKKLEKILIRREKRKVMDQMPNLVQINIPVNLSPLQAEYHASYAKGLSQIIRKKFLTPFDLQRMQLLLASMRMVCDSTYLIDTETNESPKLEELKYILFDKLDIKNKDIKIIIFSEWVKVHQLIGRLLRDNMVGYVELNGKIPVKSRGELIRKFENNPEYKIFLSTEAGGSGLNLQVADTLINFELPWNPAKKNQRIGRIDRIGQRSTTLTIYNLITRNSIESQIASGLLVKQSLFDSVLGEGKGENFVDFSTKGRSQFINQLEEFIAGTTERDKYEEVTTEDEPALAAEPEPELQEINFTEEPSENQEPEISPVTGTTTSESKINKIKEMETVMNSGMQFLAGLYKMTTGKELSQENQKIEINAETGEVTMKFKLPV
ncbi:MAG: DEAD/DEAH box helicase [Bacteroidales bacterium]